MLIIITNVNIPLSSRLMGYSDTLVCKVSATLIFCAALVAQKTLLLLWKEPQTPSLNAWKSF